MELINPTKDGGLVGKGRAEWLFHAQLPVPCRKPCLGCRHRETAHIKWLGLRVFLILLPHLSSLDLERKVPKGDTNSAKAQLVVPGLKGN